MSAVQTQMCLMIAVLSCLVPQNVIVSKWCAVKFRAISDFGSKIASNKSSSTSHYICTSFKYRALKTAVDAFVSSTSMRLHG